MPFPRALACFNRRVTNRLLGPLAGRLPPLALVEHVGRRSGRRYRTVVWAFPRADGLAIALTYTAEADWVRNVVAAGECRVKWLGSWRPFTAPDVVEGPAALRLLPAELRPVLRLADVDQVLRLRATQS